MTSPHYGRRAHLAMAVLLSVALAGCVPFEAKFDASGTARDPNAPLLGRWAGTWSSQSSGESGQARAVIEKGSPSTYTIWLELSGYRNILATWISASDVPVEPTHDGREHFKAKVPLEAIPKQDVWAVAIELDGQASAASLRVQFRTNDAIRELDRGTIRLSR